MKTPEEFRQTVLEKADAARKKEKRRRIGSGSAAAFFLLILLFSVRPDRKAMTADAAEPNAEVASENEKNFVAASEPEILCETTRASTTVAATKTEGSGALPWQLLQIASDENFDADGAPRAVLIKDFAALSDAGQETPTLSEAFFETSDLLLLYLPDSQTGYAFSLAAEGESLLLTLTPTAERTGAQRIFIALATKQYTEISLELCEGK